MNAAQGVHGARQQADIRHIERKQLPVPERGKSQNPSLPFPPQRHSMPSRGGHHLGLGMAKKGRSKMPLPKHTDLG
jgi:hypothetical protein